MMTTRLARLDNYHSERATDILDTFRNGWLTCYMPHYEALTFSIWKVGEPEKALLFDVIDGEVNCIRLGGYPIKEASDALEAWLNEEVK